MMHRIENTAGIVIEATEPLPLNVGGSTGPRVVTVAFASYFYPRGHRPGSQRYLASTIGRVLLSADLARNEFQDGFEVRRRAAQAVVRLGRKTAAGIKGRGLPYDLARKVEPFPEKHLNPWFQLSFQDHMSFDGYDRRAHCFIDVRSDTDDGEPQISDELRGLLAGRFQALADGLHSAIHNPANVTFFGRGKRTLGGTEA